MCIPYRPWTCNSTTHHFVMICGAVSVLEFPNILELLPALFGMLLCPSDTTCHLPHPYVVLWTMNLFRKGSSLPGTTTVILIFSVCFTDLGTSSLKSKTHSTKICKPAGHPWKQKQASGKSDNLEIWRPGLWVSFEDNFWLISINLLLLSKYQVFLNLETQGLC